MTCIQEGKNFVLAEVLDDIEGRDQSKLAAISAEELDDAPKLNSGRNVPCDLHLFRADVHAAYVGIAALRKVANEPTVAARDIHNGRSRIIR